MQPTTNLRIASIDILRALTMVLMIFVNDLWSLKDIPEWLEHTKANEDGMGLADTVFPAFLFIVGMSIPFAIRNRRSKGDSNGKIAWHIVERGLALLIMGLFLVNGENLNASATGISRGVWNVLSCFSFILLWNAWPKTANPWLIRIAKAVAIGILIILAFICRTGKGEDLHRFATHWWGILGLIGWAYMVGALIVAFSANRFIVPLIAWIVFMALNVASHAGWIQNEIAGMLLGPLGDGGHAGLVLGGSLASLAFLHYQQQQPVKLIGVLFVIAILLFALGVYARTFWGISKIRVTPAWVLICSAITIAGFLLIYWIADLKKKASWFAFISPAGTNTLLCYLLPYFAYAIVVALGLQLPDVLLTGAVGLLKSLLFALLMVGIGGILGKWGVRLKL